MFGTWILGKRNLAASIMQMIEDDLRSTLHPQPVDTAALEALLMATAGGDSGGGSEAAEGEDLSAAGIDSAVDSDLLTEDLLEQIDLSSGVSVLGTPGLVGNQTQVQLDVSRLPRLEEYVAMLMLTLRISTIFQVISRPWPILFNLLTR